MRVCVLYFSETWPRRRRTERLVLTPITFREKLRVAPRVLFPILRYLQGAINKLFLGCRVWKEPNAKSERSPQMKSLLKVRSLAYFLTMQRFKIILRSITNRELCIHRPNTKSSHRCFMNDLQRSFHYYTVYCSSNFIIIIKFYYCYRLKCNFRYIRGKAKLL